MSSAELKDSKDMDTLTSLKPGLQESGFQFLAELGMPPIAFEQCFEDAPGVRNLGRLRFQER